MTIALGCLPEIKGNILLLKTLHILDRRLGEIKLELD